MASLRRGVHQGPEDGGDHDGADVANEGQFQEAEEAVTVYVVMVFERHSGPDVELFADQDAAVERAKNIAEEYARRPGDIEEQDYGHIYYADWGSEGDHVFVIDREVQEAS